MLNLKRLQNISNRYFKQLTVSTFLDQERLKTKHIKSTPNSKDWQLPGWSKQPALLTKRSQSDWLKDSSFTLPDALVRSNLRIIQNTTKPTKGPVLRSCSFPQRPMSHRRAAHWRLQQLPGSGPSARPDTDQWGWQGRTEKGTLSFRMTEHTGTLGLASSSTTFYKRENLSWLTQEHTANERQLQGQNPGTPACLGHCHTALRGGLNMLVCLCTSLTPLTSGFHSLDNGLSIPDRSAHASFPKIKAKGIRLWSY